jgi:hypothetical protein
MWASQGLCFLEAVTLSCTVNLRYRIREHTADSIYWYLAYDLTWTLFYFYSLINLWTRSLLWLQFVNAIYNKNNFLRSSSCLDTSTVVFSLSSTYMLYHWLSHLLYVNNQALQQFPCYEGFEHYTAFFVKQV